MPGSNETAGITQQKQIKHIRSDIMECEEEDEENLGTNDAGLA